MNTVYVATSLDGFIADKDDGLGWLPDPSEVDADASFAAFIAEVDAIVMGRRTFETVVGFGGDWPYPCPVVVLSRTLRSVPEDLAEKALLSAGAPRELVAALNAEGMHRLYIDGGHVIQTFLAEGLIDRMILTRVPVLLGGGTPLFAGLASPQSFTHEETVTLPLGLVQSTYTKVAA